MAYYLLVILLERKTQQQNKLFLIAHSNHIQLQKPTGGNSDFTDVFLFLNND